MLDFELYFVDRGDFGARVPHENREYKVAGPHFPRWRNIPVGAEIIPCTDLFGGNRDAR